MGRGHVLVRQGGGALVGLQGLVRGGRPHVSLLELGEIPMVVPLHLVVEHLRGGNGLVPRWSDQNRTRARGWGRLQALKQEHLIFRIFWRVSSFFLVPATHTRCCHAAKLASSPTLDVGAGCLPAKRGWAGCQADAFEASKTNTFAGEAQ